MTETSTVVLGVPRETFAGETRVALVPAVVSILSKSGVRVVVERGAGEQAGYPDSAYQDKGATLGSRDDVFASQIVACVRVAGANPGGDDRARVRSGQIIIGMADPLNEPEAIREYASTGAVLFALELIPRITRGQAMDVLSSMATIAGYKAVLMAADALPRMIPMMMTAAGTITPAKAFVVGAGVAGLQAIASAKRIGAVVHAYDVRPAVKEQIQSLGGKFVELPVETADAEDKGGYAKELGEDFYRRQRELMAKVVAASDFVITTAAIPGKKAPVLITGDMLKAMAPGSVVIDLAAERGGNVDVTRAGETVEVHGVKVMGPTNLAATVPYHASQMFARNVTSFVQNFVKKGVIDLSMEDEIVRGTMVTRDGDVVNPVLRERLGMAAVAS
ncbi:MAG: Re/Si-specific NAD(P)(+) transhydrogenase subunit alpha [Candidatus Krumholzibacteria bacterium]|nr:Re/Si-specific NAD(P)(+) transhydrogenase subunit alpha [Candidatus Krumholzibacteria bacterium]MDH4336016.1 Re/Si-specific NAD(P)(+) transhydrogenase subunit alpha [Candidatus Krumholzibacteria bacterium]MDH5268408.1 Re/Si-specific NAD(P)(+) transhydrogenase subunit alpha [Candidatus Krumholzibacteria bacterium]MDH5627428.1 Re/Si-specific NAD(P)(+) transhydrogenase subunit alpha [Candidatus Krumholzibacteria bacterium]